MIAVDYSGIAIAAVMAQIKDSELDLESCRHFILNSIRSIRKELRNSKNGDIVICADAGNSWRKDIFPYYKASRKASRDNSGLDWNEIYSNINTVYKELETSFPYKCIRVARSEADDILSILSKNITDEEHVIVSNDKDMVQLNMRPNVRVYSTRKASFVVEDNYEKALFTHILTGDTGDGVPNVLSDDDTFVVKEKRQRQLRKTAIESFWLGDLPLPYHYERNKKLISLFEIPEDIEKAIMEEYNSYEIKGKRSNLLSYMAKNNLRDLLEKVGDF